MSGNEAKLKLIQQLLAKAESTTPEEAEALTEHAERLMIRHGIDQALVEAMKDGSQVKPEEIVARRIVVKGQYHLQLAHLYHCISQGFNVKTVRTVLKGKQESPLWLYGYESDVDKVEQLYASLYIQMENAAKAWWRGMRAYYYCDGAYEQLKQKRSFRRGFGDRIFTRMKEIRTSTINEVKQTTGNGAELVLVNRQQAVEAFVDQSTGRLRQGRSVRISAGSYHAGGAAADRADIGASRLANLRSLGN